MIWHYPAKYCSVRGKTWNANNSSSVYSLTTRKNQLERWRHQGRGGSWVKMLWRNITFRFHKLEHRSRWYWQLWEVRNYDFGLALNLKTSMLNFMTISPTVLEILLANRRSEFNRRLTGVLRTRVKMVCYKTFIKVSKIDEYFGRFQATFKG